MEAAAATRTAPPATVHPTRSLRIRGARPSQLAAVSARIGSARRKDWREADAPPTRVLLAQANTQQASVRPEHRLSIPADQLRVMGNDPDLTRRVNVARSTVPAVTHVDYSARLQTVDAERNPRFHGLLRAFHELTGCPMLVNTSFNVRGEPIVCTLQDAYRCFRATQMDALVLEDCVLEKSVLSGTLDEESCERHLAQFQLD